MLRKTLGFLRRVVPRPLINFTHLVRAMSAVVWYGYPARTLTVIGITGTDGKTSTSHILYSILTQAGFPASLISTTGAIISNRDNQPLGLHVTTPNPFELQKFLKIARKAGSRYIVLETTSHGLDQFRVWGCHYQIGVLTNVTHEHLDYHKTYKKYLEAKAKLFRSVQTSILNRDDGSYERMRLLASGKVFSYGLAEREEVEDYFAATEIDYLPEGTSFNIPQMAIRVRSKFVGPYNVQNMLAAVCAAAALDIPPEAIKAGLETASPPPGRLEPVNQGQDFSVFIDFAHTPNSLENLLKLLRGMAQKNLIVVFGCAGERDPGKRFPMGSSAARYCDYTVITAEDPRTENLDDIMAEIAAGCDQEGGLRDQTYFCIGDRQEAIDFAIQKLAQPGDIVVTTGKAHEQSMCYGITEYPWDEFAAVRKALAGRKVNHDDPAPSTPVSTP